MKILGIIIALIVAWAIYRKKQKKTGDAEPDGKLRITNISVRNVENDR